MNGDTVEFTLTTQNTKYTITGVPCYVMVIGNKPHMVVTKDKAPICVTKDDGEMVTTTAGDITWGNVGRHTMYIHRGSQDSGREYPVAPVVDLTRVSRSGWKADITNGGLTTCVVTTNTLPEYSIVSTHPRIFDLVTLSGHTKGTLTNLNIHGFDKLWYGGY